MKSIAMFGAFDTKGEEFAYLLECMRGIAPDVKVITIDASARTHTAAWKPDVSSEEVARMGGGDLNELAKGDRLEAVTVMIEGAKKCIRALYDEGKLAGAITLGGGTGTVLGMQVMRQLPIGLPKILVSTIAASATTGRMWQGSDILVMNSVVDIAGLNRISRAVFRSAAGAIVGAVQAGGLPQHTEKKPVVAATMYGMTTPGVEAAKAVLEKAGCEVLVFHANGAGGRTMEQMIRAGEIDGVLDLTTTEWADTLCGGVCAAGKERLDAAAQYGVPQVVSVGALDMVNMNDRPARYAGRLFHGNEKSSLMRTTPSENRQLGEIIAAKLNACTAPCALVLPLRGVSQIDRENGPFWDPEADGALFDAIRGALASPCVQLEEVPLHINDKAFGELAAQRLLSLMAAAKKE